jgi:hypothetical protein
MICNGAFLSTNSDDGDDDDAGTPTPTNDDAHATDAPLLPGC